MKDAKRTKLNRRMIIYITQIIGGHYKLSYLKRDKSFII